MNSIHEVPLKDRQEAWKYQHGEVCMGLVVDLCSELSNSKLPTAAGEAAVLYSKVLGLYALYGRPFKQRQPFRLSSEIVVPPDLLQSHRSFLTLRDKLFAHIDLDEDGIRDDKGDFLGKMVIYRTNDSMFSMMSTAMPTQNTLLEFSNIASQVRKNCHAKIQQVWNEFAEGRELLGLGQYEINITGHGLAPLLTKLPR